MNNKKSISKYSKPSQNRFDRDDNTESFNPKQCRSLIKTLIYTFTCALYPFNFVIFILAFSGEKGSIVQSFHTWSSLMWLGFVVSLHGLSIMLADQQRMENTIKNRHETEDDETETLVSKSSSTTRSRRSKWDCFCTSKELFQFVCINTMIYFMLLINIYWIRAVTHDIEVANPEVTDSFTYSLIMDKPKRQIEYFYLLIQALWIITFLSLFTIWRSWSIIKAKQL